MKNGSSGYKLPEKSKNNIYWWNNQGVRKLYYLVAVLLLMILLLALPIEIRVFYQRYNGNDLFKIRIATLWGLVGLTVEVPVATLKTVCMKPILKMVGEVETGKGKEVISEPQYIDFTDIDYPKLYRMIKRFSKLYKKYRRPIYYFFKGLQIRRFNWKTELGLADPALTGLSVGLAWSVKGWIYGKLHRITNFMAKKTEVKVLPKFQTKCFSTEVDCIIGFRIGHIMVTGINFISTRLWAQRG